MMRAGWLIAVGLTLTLLLSIAAPGTGRADRHDYCIHVPDDTACYAENEPSVQHPIRLEFNGRRYVYYPAEDKAMLDPESRRLLVPLRIMREIPGTKWTLQEGGTLWFRRTWRLSAARMRLGSRKMTDTTGIVDFYLDTYPRQIGSTVYVPARAAADLLGCYSEWRAWEDLFAIDCRRRPVSDESLDEVMQREPPGTIGMRTSSSRPGATKRWPSTCTPPRTPSTSGTSRHRTP